MKRLLLLAAAACFLLRPAPAAANAADRDYITSKLQFVYLPNPNDATSAQKFDGKAVANAGQFTPNPALTSFGNLAQALLSDKPAGGLASEAQERLQSVVAKTLRVTDKPIRVVLVNDLNGPITNTKAINDFSLSLSDRTDNAGNVIASRRVWPAAMVVGSDPDADPAARAASPYGGSFAMGAYRVTQDADNFPNFTAVLWVFCHELTHTQDLSYFRWQEFRVMVYGQDYSHFFTEAVPSMAASYGEGLANFVGWSFARRNMDQVSAWFGTDGEILVEKAPTGAGLHPDLYQYNTLDDSRREKTPTGNTNIDTNYGRWKISNLPPKMVLHNEQMIALALYYRGMATPDGFDKVYRAFTRSNPGNYRVSTSAWAQMVDRLCTQDLPSGTTRANVSNQTVGPAVLTIALCDYFTHFRAKDAAEFTGMFEGLQYLKDWITNYDTSSRAGVRDAVSKWEAAHPVPASGLTREQWGQRVADITQVIAKTLGAK